MFIFMDSSLMSLVMDLIYIHYSTEMDLESLFRGKFLVF